MISGLRVLDEWIPEAEAFWLFNLIGGLPWRDDLKRRVQHYGYRYDYTAKKATAEMRLGPLPDWALALAQRLVREGLFAAEPDQVIVNEYLPGQGISKHIDCIPCFGPTIASLSLGSTCEMTLLKGEEERRTILRPRSLLVLDGEARAEWQHAIPARQADVVDGERTARQTRISLTFRTMRLAA